MPRDLFYGANQTEIFKISIFSFLQFSMDYKKGVLLVINTNVKKKKFPHIQFSQRHIFKSFAFLKIIFVFMTNKTLQV